MTRRTLLALLAWILIGSQTFGAIAYDAVSNATIGTGNLSWTHTPVGTPRGAIVTVVQAGVSSDQVSGVTYGGVAMTELSVSPLAQAGGEVCIVYQYFLGASLPTGAQTVVVTVTNSTNKSGSCITVTAAADLEIVDVDDAINSTSSADPSATLALGGRTCFAMIGFHTGQNDPAGSTPFTNWSSRYEPDFGTRCGGTYTYDIVSTTDVTIGWTQTAEDATAIGVAISEILAPGGQGMFMVE